MFPTAHRTPLFTGLAGPEPWSVAGGGSLVATRWQNFLDAGLRAVLWRCVLRRSAGRRRSCGSRMAARVSSVAA